MTREELQQYISSFEPKSRLIKAIIVHSTGTAKGKDYTLKTIEKWHKEMGLTQIGFHFVVHPDGTIDPGRPMALSGGLVKGKNAHILSVGYLGGKGGDTRTDEQKESLEWVLTRLVERIPDINDIAGHRDVSRTKTDSPGFDARKEYRHIIEDR